MSSVMIVPFASRAAATLQLLAITVGLVPRALSRYAFPAANRKIIARLATSYRF